MKNLYSLNLALLGRAFVAVLVLLASFGQVNAQCDQTIVSDTLMADYQGTPVGFCVDLDFMVALRSDRYIDGVLQTNFAEGCDFDSMVYYPYGTFPGAGAAGPYELVDWSIDGNSLNVMFADVNDLVVQMNNFNPSGSWINEQLTRNIIGGEDGRDYSPMIVEQMGTGIRRNVNPNISRVANGTLVIVDGAGFHEYVVDDPTTGCRDTLTLFLRPELEDIELEIFTDFNQESAVFCLDNSGLSGTPQTATICDAPDDGTLNDQGGYCYTYTPDAGQTGTDMICIEVCDDTSSPLGPICQRTLISMITRSPANFTTDTIRFQMTNVDTTVCVNAVLELGTTADFAEVCGPVPSGLSIIPSTNGCVDILPEASFSGPAIICVSHCVGAICDTTILDFTVLSACDLGIFSTDAESIPGQGNPTPYCIPVDQNQLNAYSIEVNGQVYGGSLSDCDIEQQFFYNYAPLVGNGSMGPYSLTQWTVDGQNFSTTFQDPTELETFMRANDPGGNWRLDAGAFNIVGGDPATVYGTMVIVHNATGTQSELLANPIDIARGANIDLPGDGVYVIDVTNPVTGCTDQITVTVGQVPSTTTTTINITVQEGDITPTTCLFNTPRDTFSICGDVSNGTTTFDASNCVVYEPNPGFIGMDTLCVVSCDLPGGTVCDTTYAIFTVVPVVPPTTTTQTITVTVFVDSISQTTCLFNAPRDTFSICGDVSNGTTTFDASNCVVYEPNPGFIGMDTLCVVSCDLPGGTVCDTTYAIFDVVPRIPTSTTITQTITVTVFVDSISQTTCLFNTPRDTFSICGDVNNGTTTFDASNCVVYEPNPGFIGMDTLCVVNCDLPGGTVCDTTYAIFDVVPRIPPSTTTTTINVTVIEDGITPTTCLFNMPRDTFSICGDVSNGVTTFDVNNCVVYEPDPGFTGLDTLCVVSCDLPGATVCDTTYAIFNVIPRTSPVDTIYLTNFGDAPFNLCNGLPITGPFSSVSICGVTGPFSAAISPDGECVIADPDDGTAGTGEICVTFCSTTNPIVCQEVLFIISQTPSCAPPLFSQDTVVIGPSVGDVEYCLANGVDLSDYEVYVNGTLTTPSTDPSCGGGGGGGGQDVYFYPLLFINDGPLRIDAWDINGNTILNVVTTGFSQLADTMSALDPGNDWTYDAAEQGLVATSDVGNYSQLILFDLTFGSTYTIPIETLQQGGGGGSGTGSVITIPQEGVYDIEVIALDGNCGDRLVIHREGVAAPDRDTVTFAAIADQLNGPLCLDVSELGVAPTSIQSCGDPMNGTIAFTNFECLNYTPNNGFIGSDTACVVICTNGGLLCDTTVVIFDVTDNSACPEIWNETTSAITTDDCTAAINVCLPAFPDEFFYYTVRVDGVVQTGALACGADSVTTYSYADVAGQGQTGPYRIEGYNLSSGTFTNDLADINVLLDSLNTWDPNGNWMINPSNFTIFGGVSGFAYDTINLRQIATDTLNRLVPVTTLIENQIGFDLTVGSYSISVTDNRTNCTDTLRYDVICSTGNECPDLTAANGTDLTLVDCSGTTGFEVLSPTTDPADLQVFVDGVLQPATANAASIVVFLGEGVFEVIVVDPIRSCANTFTVNVMCGPCPGPIPTSTIAAGVDCSSNDLEVCLPAAPDVLQAYAITIDGQAYTGALGNCNEVSTFVIDIFELPDGGSVGPYTIDSFRINGELFSTDVSSMQALADTLNVWDATGTWRYDVAELLILGGNPISAYSDLFVTQISSGTQVQVPLMQEDIAQGTIITIPAGANTRVLTFDNGVDCIQEVTLTVACTSNSTASDTITITGSTVFCVDDSELSGPIVSLENVCPDPTGAATFDFDGQLGCVTATGVSVGSVTSCLVACDAAGICDTTFYTVVVTPDGSGGLDAVDDVIRIRLDQPGAISVTANDTFNGPLSSITIIDEPSRGTALLNPDGTLSYTPNSGECGFTDSLTYQICQGTICDRALVLIQVRCEPVEAYSGFSPNGDGINDQFRFIGIEDFPANILTIYNRWGNEIHVAENYQNDWSGTWDGKILIDGTYFWQLEIEGEDKPLTGYVQIRR